MNQFFSSSNLKLEFAEIYLHKILNFDEHEQKYRDTVVYDAISTSATSDITNTEKILKDLNRYLECYFFTAMSSLDALAHEIFDKFDLKKQKRIYITIFTEKNAEKRPEIQKICQELNKKKPGVLSIIQSFLKDYDFERFKSYRDFVAHKSILGKELFFETKQTTSGAFSTLNRPIVLPEIVNNELSANELDLEKCLKSFHKKIVDFHQNVKSKIQ